MFVLAFSQARADTIDPDPIIKVQNRNSTCSDGTCNGSVPFDLSLIENGTQSLTIGGTESAATYIVKDDISGSTTSVIFSLSGLLRSNQFLNIQFGGGFAGTGTLTPNDLHCTNCGGNDGHTNYYNPQPVGNGGTFNSFSGVVWDWEITAADALHFGDVFEIQFSSFGNGDTAATGANPNETQAPTPLPATFPLFATGLGALGLLGWRRKRKAQAVA